MTNMFVFALNISHKNITWLTNKDCGSSQSRWPKMTGYLLAQKRGKLLEIDRIEYLYTPKGKAAMSSQSLSRVLTAQCLVLKAGPTYFLDLL